MKNPEYYRLLKDGHFVGVKRIVTEYIPASGFKWQLEPIDHNPEENQKLSKPPLGCEGLKREKIGKA